MTEAVSFGDQLRRERERRGVTLATIARHTNVTSRYFSDLERGDCSRWPARLYSRSFLRGYAEVVGLDPDRVLAEAARCIPLFADDERPRAPEEPPPAVEGADRTLRLRLDVTDDRRSHAALVARTLALDGASALLVAATAALAGAPFWPALAVVLCVWHVVARGRSRAIRPAPLMLWQALVALRPSPARDLRPVEEQSRLMEAEPRGSARAMA